jgi:hypothetical protein
MASPSTARRKMATGAGKTTVMAMLIAWQTVNAIHSPNSALFSRGFLIITPGITIRDRLRVLLPDDPDAYYAKRELVPADMLPEFGKGKIVLTNYHAPLQPLRQNLGSLGARGDRRAAGVHRGLQQHRDLAPRV